MAYSLFLGKILQGSSGRSLRILIKISEISIILKDPQNYPQASCYKIFEEEHRLFENLQRSFKIL